MASTGHPRGLTGSATRLVIGAVLLLGATPAARAQVCGDPALMQFDVTSKIVRSRVGFTQVAVDRGDQPPHPVPIQLILAAQVRQHLRLRHAADTLVVRELDVPHHRAVPIPALRRPQVHAHQQSRNNHGDQARHGKSCAHANPCFPTIRNAPSSANADQKARVCPLTAEVG